LKKKNDNRQTNRANKLPNEALSYAHVLKRPSEQVHREDQASPIPKMNTIIIIIMIGRVGLLHFVEKRVGCGGGGFI
jgi:hypothetical protein